jgi:hypothetical protein
MFMSSRSSRILALLLVFTFPVSLFSAETHAAMVFATGPASLNGAALPRSTAVFAGDLLKTSKDSAIIINANGSTIQVGGDSSVQFQGDSINLNSGVAQVTTHNGMRVEASVLTIAPNRNEAKYQVSRLSGKVMVAALNGSVSVLHEGSTDVVSAGQSKEYTEVPQDTEKDKRKKDKAGAVVFTSDKTLFTAGATILGGGGALAWWMLRDNRKPVSNQLPGGRP